MSLLYALLRSLLGLLSRSKRGEVTEIENAVLRHQLKVLRRQVRQVRFRPFDCVWGKETRSGREIRTRSVRAGPLHPRQGPGSPVKVPFGHGRDMPRPDRREATARRARFGN